MLEDGEKKGEVVSYNVSAGEYYLELSSANTKTKLQTRSGTVDEGC